jgi:hypothetical protein
MSQSVEPGADVRYCQHCKCKTWHVDGICEWSDGHKDPHPMTSIPKDKSLEEAEQ